MPRRNRQRSVFAEAHVAKRLKIEREARGWSYDRVAEEMETLGCPIRGSAIFKIENSNPPRVVSVDELVALSQVFEVPLDEFVMEPAIAVRREVADSLRKMEEASRRLMQNGRDLFALRAAARDPREVLDAVRRYFEDQGQPKPEDYVDEMTGARKSS
jgi:transcriptional regulator with XRE-family HTH domain